MKCESKFRLDHDSRVQLWQIIFIRLCIVFWVQDKFKKSMKSICMPFLAQGLLQGCYIRRKLICLNQFESYDGKAELYMRTLSIRHTAIIQCSMLAGHSGSKKHWHKVLELTYSNTTDINYKWKCNGYYVSPSVDVESGTT